MARLQILRHPEIAAVYVRFSGDVSGADFMAALQGVYASPLRVADDATIWDLSETGAVVADLEDLHALNAQGNSLTHQKAPGLIIIVAPKDDVFTLARLYSRFAERTGRMVEVVRSREGAWERLDATEPDYADLRTLMSAVPRYDAGAKPRRA